MGFFPSPYTATYVPTWRRSWLIMYLSVTWALRVRMAVPFAVVNAKGQMLVHYNVGLNITFTWNLSTEIQSSLTPFCCLLSLAPKRISGNFRNSRPVPYFIPLGSGRLWRRSNPTYRPMSYNAFQGEGIIRQSGLCWEARDTVDSDLYLGAMQRGMLCGATEL